MIQAPTGLWGVLFWTSVLLLAATLVLMLMRRLGNSDDWGHKLIEILRPPKRLAQLNRVVCYHCEQGRGIYNPVYRMHGGIPHVEGACSHCGKHISVRLKG